MNSTAQPSDTSTPLSLEALIPVLRNEIVESEKARIDFLKYKLIVVGAIGVVGLGLKDQAPYPLVLMLIPLCCLYVDILCYHNTLRILVIGQFLSQNGCPYEKFIGSIGSTLQQFGAAISKDLKKHYKAKSTPIADRLCKKNPCSDSFNKIQDFDGKKCNREIRSLLQHTLATDRDACPNSLRPEKRKNIYSDGAGYFFNLEDGALETSTRIISVLLFLFGITQIMQIPIWQNVHNLVDLFTNNNLYTHYLIPYIFLALTSLATLGLTFFIKKMYNDHKEALFKSTANQSFVRNAHKMITINNDRLKKWIEHPLNFDRLMSLKKFLDKSGTFAFSTLPNGLFPASAVEGENTYTGYHHVWVRDNIYVAYSHYLCDEIQTAKQTVITLTHYFLKHRWRFEQIISGKLDYSIPMNRPHIRFKGEDLSESTESWAHDENDALGYFLWCLGIFCQDGILDCDDDILTLISLFVNFFSTIKYWENRDSGHWEEKRKIEASSIGVVVRALMTIETLLKGNDTLAQKCSNLNCSITNVTELISKGCSALYSILPNECIESDKEVNRAYDAALLFLIFPLDVVPNPDEDKILNNVSQFLTGDYGIRRYLGDSFWTVNYKSSLPKEKRTSNISDDMTERNKLHKDGLEAQWCIFDPVISIIYGKKFIDTNDQKYFELQTYHFKRAIGQLTSDSFSGGGLQCPELYYLEQGRYIPNDTVPLLWTQANLKMAFKFMADSIEFDNR